jgi:putative pyruvate formate lyase activating enzyme
VVPIVNRQSPIVNRQSKIVVCGSISFFLRDNACMSAPNFILDPFTPAYVALHESGELARRAAAAYDALHKCRFCPRHCRVDRLAGQFGFCKTGASARVTSVFPHHGEEDCLRGRHGSGTIFINRCNLQCVFCQNADISQETAGIPVSAEGLADAMLQLQDLHCHNINFVTPTHVLPQILAGLRVAVEHGLRLPLVWNSGGYDSVDALKLLDGVVDIYMPDFKFWNAETAERLCLAKDYPERAREALMEMHRQVGVLKLGPDGVARRGVLVRHLVMPGLVNESAAIFEFLAKELSPDTFVNVMAQYRPAHRVSAKLHAEINRRPTPDELSEAIAAARAAGLWRFD